MSLEIFKMERKYLKFITAIICLGFLWLYQANAASALG